MAVKSKNSLRRTSLIVLAAGVFSLPAIAQAAPEDRGNWRQRVAREDAPRAERREQTPDIAPQAEQAPRARQNWSPPPQAQGTVDAAPPSRWTGGDDRRGSAEDRGRGWRDRSARTEPLRTRQEQDVMPARTGWSDRSGRADQGERRVRSDQWRGRAAQAGTWQDRTASAERAAPPSTARTGTDWRSRVQRTGQDRNRDRNYWRQRDWNSHWDRSRRNNWSGWNNQWNWTWGSDYRRWNTQWRSSNRYDWYSWRNRYPGYFQVGAYYAPYRNYSYRRLSIGHFLNALFFDQDYWIADPWYYRLPEAYGPYRWVRYYDDAVLVNIYSGEIADVIHHFFW